MIHVAKNTPTRCSSSTREGGYRLLQLLLGAQVVRMAALGLTAISSPGVQPGVAFTANHFVAVVFLCKNTQRRFNDTTTQTEHQM